MSKQRGPEGFPRSLCLTAAFFLAACGEGPTPPPPPLSIQKPPTSSGDQQTDTVFATLAPFRVLVQRGTTPAPGVSVSWTPTDSGAQPSQTTTDASGIASLTLLRSDRVGTRMVKASVTDAVGSPVTFTAIATAGHPILRIVSGNNQMDTTQARLAADYVVQVTDSHGNAFAGAVIDWAVTAGGGTITPARSTTDASGHASARHTLGADAGPQTVTATATALAATPQVTFTAVTLGILQVTATTTGVDLDPDGYSVSVFRAPYGTTALLAPNATTSIRLRPGDYKVTLELGDLALNCDTISPTSRTATVPSGGMVEVAFNVACAPARLLAFGIGDDIYTIKSNGTALTHLPVGGFEPAWSPDGSKIAFSGNRGGSTS